MPQELRETKNRAKRSLNIWMHIHPVDANMNLNECLWRFIINWLKDGFEENLVLALLKSPSQSIFMIVLGHNMMYLGLVVASLPQISWKRDWLPAGEINNALRHVPPHCLSFPIFGDKELLNSSWSSVTLMKLYLYPKHCCLRFCSSSRPSTCNTLAEIGRLEATPVLTEHWPQLSSSVHLH